MEGPGGNPLEPCFSTFLMLPPFNTGPHAAVSPTTRVFLLLFQNCNFATVLNCIKYLCFPMVLGDHCEKVNPPPSGARNPENLGPETTGDMTNQTWLWVQGQDIYQETNSPARYDLHKYLRLGFSISTKPYHESSTPTV